MKSLSALATSNRSQTQAIIIICSALCFLFSVFANAASDSKNSASHDNSYHSFNARTKSDSSASSVLAPKKRIITLSPHLTEIVYELQQSPYVVAVSDFSDYPKSARKKPSVASYQGANIAEIIRLRPTHILVWRGGNKDVDIQKLLLLGFNIYESKVQSPDDLVQNIKEIGKFLSVPTIADALSKKLEFQIQQLRDKYTNQQISALYYLNQHPLSGLGNDPWLNKLLSLCQINNIYADSVSAYPQLQISDILRKKPELIIAADNSSLPTSIEYWQSHGKVFTPKIIIASPDALHRFTSRAIDEIVKVCEQAHK